MLLHAPSYRKAFWTGCLHAAIIVLYTIFITLIWLSLVPIMQDIIAVSIVVSLFIIMLSAAVIAYMIFFAPFKLIVHHHFKVASILIVSTLGWLFVFLLIFVLGFVQTYYS